MRIALLAPAAIAALLAATPALFAGYAWAASPDAWNDLASSARKACTADITKRLGKTAKVTGVTGTVLGIGAVKDADRYYALTLKGTAGKFPYRWLCLYDKRDLTLVTREFEEN